MSRDSAKSVFCVVIYNLGQKYYLIIIIKKKAEEYGCRQGRG